MNVSGVLKPLKNRSFGCNKQLNDYGLKVHRYGGVEAPGSWRRFWNAITESCCKLNRPSATRLSGCLLWLPLFTESCSQATIVPAYIKTWFEFRDTLLIRIIKSL